MNSRLDAALDEVALLEMPAHISHHPYEHGLCGKPRAGRPFLPRETPVTCAECVEGEEAGACVCGWKA